MRLCAHAQAHALRQNAYPVDTRPDLCNSGPCVPEFRTPRAVTRILRFHLSTTRADSQSADAYAHIRGSNSEKGLNVRSRDSRDEPQQR
eukprot:5431973-Pleurochrysis_carterae.AAC.1